MPNDVITSTKDARLATFRRRPEDHALFLAEGAAMIRHGLDAGWTPRAVLVLDTPAPEVAALERRCALVSPTSRAARGVFYKVLGLGYETATEALGVFDVPDHGPAVLSSLERNMNAVCLVGEDIQDPRNVGVLVRTADALGVRVFALSRSSAWPWSRQAIRSTTGSIFRTAIHVAPTAEEALGSLREMGVTVLGSSAGATRTLDTLTIRYPCALVVGNEATGLTPRVRELCDAVVGIPLAGGAHSLNVTVAAGILLDALRRRSREA